MADLTAWLDELEEAHKAATQGPWVIAEWHDATILAQPYLDSLNAGEPQDVRPPFLHTTASNATDAAAIVAEHNATPKLVAALRGVLALAEGWIAEAQARGVATDLHFAGFCLRAAVADVLAVARHHEEGTGA